ncbi:MAG: UDP-N-acetylglucosamine 2-epimerase [Eubacteriales bacterium]
MKTVGVVTGTRAEYGLLQGVIQLLLGESTIHMKVIVTGTHLSEAHGMTVEDIRKDGIEISTEIPILEPALLNEGVSMIMARTLERFGQYFQEEAMDMLVLLGDRYEIFAVAIAAMNARIPIAHIHGGEITQGAMDDAMRHSITKLSYLHFTSTEEYRNRVIQLGEHPNRVFHVGSLGVENCKKQVLMSQIELEDSIGYVLGDYYAVVTYHPVTLEVGDMMEEIHSVVNALREYPNLKYLCTKANADEGGNLINEYLEKMEQEEPERFKLVDSLGMKRYLSALQSCTMVIGNSSSGILEAPAMKVPTVNIGDRQLGRTQAASIFNCNTTSTGIIQAMEEAKQWNAHSKHESFVNSYEKADTAKNIAEIIRTTLEQETIDLKKEFYDINSSS